MNCSPCHKIINVSNGFFYIYQLCVVRSCTKITINCYQQRYNKQLSSPRYQQCNRMRELLFIILLTYHIPYKWKTVGFILRPLLVSQLAKIQPNKINSLSKRRKNTWFRANFGDHETCQNIKRQIIPENIYWAKGKSERNDVTSLPLTFLIPCKRNLRWKFSLRQ